MFALISDKKSISLKCDPYLSYTFRQQYPAITPGYHLNKEHWNTVILDGSVPHDEIEWLIDHSYDLVYNRLTKEEKKGIDAL